jgi:hypothetical protein
MDNRIKDWIWWGFFLLVILIGVLLTILATIPEKELFWLELTGVICGTWLFMGNKIINF